MFRLYHSLINGFLENTFDHLKLKPWKTKFFIVKTLDFRSSNSKEKLRNYLKESEEIKPVIDQEKALVSVTEAFKTCFEIGKWMENLEMSNREKIKKKALKAGVKGYQPDYRFKDPFYHEETFLDLINKIQESIRDLEEQDLEVYRPESLDIEDIKRLFIENFEELKNDIRICSNGGKREIWLENSLEKWPMVSKATFRNSKKTLTDWEKEKTKSDGISFEQIEKIWRKDLEKLGMEYGVERRKVKVCHNLPEQKKLVIAEGKNGGRQYTEKEAARLTSHEIFHAVRAYNGFETGSKSSFPEIIGLHTPYYSKTEEGGAVYREHRQGTIYPEKEFDYHLMLVASYLTSKGELFEEVVKELQSLGATKERSIHLAARSREALRLHIYQGGYYEEWKDLSDQDADKLMIGKVNEEWGQKLYREAENDGMLEKPKISAEKVFKK